MVASLLPQRPFGLFLVLMTAFSSISVRALIPSDAVNLPFGDINVVVLTDVHSWDGSHGHQEPYYDADLGDILSFWERVKDHCDSSSSPDVNPEQPMDVFFVNNGDFVHGTGLSQMVDGQNDPSALVPLLEKMPYDAVNVGNHELYSKKNIQYMTQPGGYVDWWGDRYLTSNIHKTTTQDSHGTGTVTHNKEPLGNRYKILHGTNGGTKLLTFGFLYNMRDYAPNAGIAIESVEFVIQQEWFTNALTEEHYDAILILAHMDLVDPLVEKLRLAIRNHIGDGTPIVFITGHTHYRGVKQLEDLTMTFEAGKYLDTVGFVSFPRKESIRNSENAFSSLFKHAFLDTSKKVLFQDTLGFSRISDGETKNGKDLSKFIDETRQKLGLQREIGCAPQSYFVQRHVDDPDSLWGLYRDQVIPKIFTRLTMRTIEEEATQTEDNLPMAMLLGRDAWRYDLYHNSTLIVDDIISVAPFNDSVVHLGTFSADLILQANKTLNEVQKGDDLTWSPVLPKYILIGDVGEGHLDEISIPSSKTKYHLYSHDFSAETVRRVLEKIDPSQPVDIRKTELTSIMIWLAFVEEFWSCDGKVGFVPDWFPAYDYLTQRNTEDGKMDKTKGLIWIGILMILIGTGTTAVALSWIFCRSYAVYQPVLGGEEDIVSFQEDDDYEVHDGGKLAKVQGGSPMGFETEIL